MPAVFDGRFVTRIDGPNVKKGSNKMELAEGLTEDIRKFKESTGAFTSGHDLVWLDRSLS